MSNKLYDILKWISLVALDAIGLCYQGLAGVWGWPYGDQVLQTCTLISVAIGTLIGVTGSTYYKKQAVSDETSDNTENN